ncbi:MAG: AAA family ATPase [Saprospiraceae bacterium]|nr:AAA family ATPase [Saprospiraceae bacterium]
MKITKITVNNLHSLRLQATIDFSSPPLSHAGLIAITGDTGAGKTTLLDAITLALYGRIHRNKDAKDVMSYGAVESLAEVEFETHKGLFRAKWSIWRAHKKDDGDIKGPRRELSQWNSQRDAFEIIAEKAKEVDEQVEAVSGLDYDRFCRSVLLSQGDFAAFLKSGEKERSELLERITGVEIYSRLSMAAFERNKLEQQRLEDLRQSLELTQAPGDEEMAAWDQALTRYQSEGEAISVQRDQLQKQSQWLQRLKELDERQVLLQTELQATELEKTENERLKVQLQNARKAAAFQPDLALLESLNQRIDQLKAEIADFDIQAQTARQKLDESQQENEALQETLSALQADFQIKYPLWEKALALDAAIQEKDSGLQAQLAQQAAQEKTWTELAQQLEAQSAQLKDWENIAQTSALWLESHASWQSLPQQLPLMQDKRNELRLLWKELQDAKQKEEHTETQLADITRKLDTALLARQEAEEKLQQLQTEFERLAPEYYAPSRQELLHLLVQEIEGLNDKQGQLKQWADIQSVYQQKLKMVADMEDRLSHLQLEEEDVNKTLMVALDALDDYNQRLQYADKIYDQQRQIANYEKDRELLAEGEPCPLCFSTHHPFRAHAVKPMVDEARAVRDKAQQQYNQALARQQSLLRRQNELYNETKRLRGSEEGLERLRLDLLDIEAQLVSAESAVLPGFVRPQSAKGIAELVSNISESLADKRRRRVQLMELDKSIAALEKSAQLASQAYAEAQGAHMLAQERGQAASKWQTEINAKWEQSVAQINALLQPYGLTFDVEQGAAIFDTLQERATEYAQQRARLEEAQREKAAKAQRTEQLSEELTRLQERLDALNLSVATQRAVLEESVAERKAVLGDEDPQTARASLQTAIAQQQALCDQARESRTALEKELESLRRLHQGKTNELHTASNNMEALQKELLKKLKKADFDSIEALQQALLEPDVLQQMEENLQEHEKRRFELERQWKELLHNQAQVRAKSLTTETAETIAEWLTGVELQYRSTMQEIGALREKKSQGEQRRQEAQSLLEQIAAQENTCLRWSKLNDIIGQADGKKFRVFAQGLTLQKLTSLANRHLQQLNGRYIIHKSQTEDLALEIIDTYQANNKRSMSTLSGGESFLVSLALALGLSDLAGKNALIKSLFVDEGFGTLDDNSLDLAISTLENLQASGKTIGVISHVKALKERVSTQIQVKMKGNGFSEIAVSG